MQRKTDNLNMTSMDSANHITALRVSDYFLKQNVNFTTANNAIEQIM